MTYIECPDGQEQGPAIEGTDPYCVTADQPLPVESSVPIYMPVEPIENEPVETLPPALPLDPLPGEPVVVVPMPRELAETGPADPLTVMLVGGIVLLAGAATWLTRSR